MSSQYEKRKAKAQAELEAKRAEIRAKADVEPSVPAKAPETQKGAVYTQTGYDVYSPDNGKNYRVAEIEYNPETGEARVKNTDKLSRLIALTYSNHKDALRTLKKNK